MDFRFHRPWACLEVLRIIQITYTTAGQCNHRLVLCITYIRLVPCLLFSRLVTILLPEERPSQDIYGLVAVKLPDNSWTGFINEQTGYCINTRKCLVWVQKMDWFMYKCQINPWGWKYRTGLVAAPSQMCSMSWNCHMTQNLHSYGVCGLCFYLRFK